MEISKEIKKKENYSIKEVLLIILLAIIIILIGLIVINQAIEWRYKYQLLSSPCNLCRELNPELENCFTKKEIINGNEFNLTFNFTYP